MTLPSNAAVRDGPGLKVRKVLVTGASRGLGRGISEDIAAYVASKHAVGGLSMFFARELAPRGIRFNAVCPGWVKTDAALPTARRMTERQAISEAAVLAWVSAAQILPGIVRST